MSDKAQKSFRLPYQLDLILLDKILNDLKNTSLEGIKQDTLWLNVGAVKDSNRSYTLNTAKYLGLVETGGGRVWLTPFGLKSIRFSSGDDRKTILTKNLPEEYLVMFKWIKNDQELKSNEIKQKFIDAWGQPQSSVVLDKAIATFLNYCQYLKLIKYLGKGNQARAVITDFGRTVLDTTVDQESKSQIPPTDPNTVKASTVSPSVQLASDAIYPIKIITKDRGSFDWDIQSETDWAVVESVLTSIKEGWKKNQPRGES